MPPKPCKPGQERNPLTGRCKKIARTRKRVPVVSFVPPVPPQVKVSNDRSEINRLEKELGQVSRELRLSKTANEKTSRKLELCLGREEDLVNENILLSSSLEQASEDLRKCKGKKTFFNFFRNRTTRSQGLNSPVNTAVQQQQISFISNLVGEMSSTDLISLEDFKLGEYVKENKKHIAFIIDNNFKPMDKRNIKFEGNQFYECKSPNGFIVQTMENTKGPRLIGLRKIGAFGYIPEDDMKRIMDSPDNVHILKSTKKGEAFVSKDVLDGGTVVSAAHCQAGASDNIYNLEFSFKFN